MKVETLYTIVKCTSSVHYVKLPFFYLKQQKGWGPDDLWSWVHIMVATSHTKIFPLPSVRNSMHPAFLLTRIQRDKQLNTYDMHARIWFESWGMLNGMIPEIISYSPVISPVSGWIVMVFGLNPWEQDGDDTGDRRTRTFASHITPQNLPQSTHTTSKYLFRYDEHACHSIIQPAHSIITDHGARRPVVAITIIRSIEGSPMSHRWPIGAVAVESRYL